ncbi:siderophore ABC transporter substrate-binding protein [Paroceanicella profunda]|nr:siderophore ABC transporter substrate-binding protein [Paroceanicella profunda]
MMSSPHRSPRRALALAALLSAAALPAAAQEQITVEHARGTTELAPNPHPVMVFPFFVLDTMQALGIPVEGVASNTMPGWLAESYADTSRIGTLFEPDMEAIAAAAPELIITGGRSTAKFDALSPIAPVIDLSVDPQDFLGSAERDALLLGRIFGREAEAEALVARTNAAVAALKEKAAGAGTGLLVLTTGGRMSAFGPGSRFGILHDAFGITPAVPDLEVATHGQAISNEFILEADPDWLFVIDRDAAIGQPGGGAAQLLDNALVRQTKAWQEGHVVYLDPARWYLAGGGLPSILASAEALDAALGAAKP